MFGNFLCIFSGIKIHSIFVIKDWKRKENPGEVLRGARVTDCLKKHQKNCRNGPVWIRYDLTNYDCMV